MKYICDPQVIPTVVPENYDDLERFLRTTTYATEVHIDVADGVFASHVTWPLNDMSGEALRACAALVRESSLHIGVHLMTASPLEHGILCAQTGCKTVMGHTEAFTDDEEARAALAAWKGAGAERVGLALRIDTPLSRFWPLMERCDFVHLMSISEIGAQGFPYDDQVLHRIEEVHAHAPDILVEVDGGISEANIEDVVRAGANKICVGSALSKSDAPAQMYMHLYERAMRGCVPQVGKKSTVTI